MPNKKPSRNAYFFFALKMIPELRRRGLKVSGVKEAIPLCSADWALLSPVEKEKYTEKAKEWKSREPDPPRPSSNVLHLHEVKTYSDFTDDRTCGLMEKMSSFQVGAQMKESDWSRRKCEDLDKSVIYIINIFSHGEMPSVCGQRFVPCEIGCVRYSLQSGIMGSLHDFIDPGELPLGFRYHCQAGSAATHQIPVSGFELVNRDYRSLFRYLCDFVSPSTKHSTSLYCKNNDIHRVRWCLQWLAAKAGMENPFELLDVESLIIKFYRDKLNEEPSKSSVHRLLDVVQWDYAQNTRCRWHEDNDMWCCALASCKKVTYCMSKALACVYDVDLTSAHLPNLQTNDNQKPENSKIVVLDAKKYQQKKMDRLYPSGNGNSLGAVGGEGSPGMRGVSSIPTVKPRGRGILRLLEDMPPPFATSG